MNHLKPVLGFCILFFALFITQMQVEGQVSFGKSQNINSNWNFIQQDIKNGQENKIDESKWRALDLPHDWSIEGVLSPANASCMGYLPCGIGWYRKLITISPDQKGLKHFIYFEGVYKKSEVFLNGFSLGVRPSGYSSFMYDLEPYLKYGEENILAVRVDHSENADSRFYTGSGIYRDVFLIAAGPVHIEQWGIYYQTTEATKSEASINVQVNIKNTTKTEPKVSVNLTLLTQTGEVVAKQTKNIPLNPDGLTLISADLKVKNPKIWSLNSPSLYQLKTQVIENAKIIDENIQPLGIRKFNFDVNKGFTLNGESMKLKGVCIHHEAGCLGAAAPRKVWETRLRKLKEMGCNSIRLSHNPQAPFIYEICDQIGLLVQDEVFDEWEFSKNKWITGWNNGIPGLQGSAQYFNEWCERDTKDMVLRDRNHPSVIMWSIGNEIDYPNDPYSHAVLNAHSINQPARFGFFPEKPAAQRMGVVAKRLADQVRKYDNTRPVTAALAGVVMSNETEYPNALDVVGYNYTEDRYEADHKSFPARIIYGSENGQGMNAWKAVRDNEYISGQFLWTGIDYLGESGTWPSRGFGSGILNMIGTIKPNGYFRQAIWSEKPVTYIGTYKMPKNPLEVWESAHASWNYNESEMVRVVCNTNCQKSILLLNGQPVGESKANDLNTGVIFWDLPYNAGELKVIGMNNDKEVCSFKIQTYGRPYAIRATADSNELKADKDLVQILLDVVDENGVPVTIADNEITCQIEGPAKLLGLEGSNMQDMGNYRDNIQRVYNGKLMAYIQTKGEEGSVKITFSSPWLKNSEVLLKVVN